MNRTFLFFLSFLVVVMCMDLERFFSPKGTQDCGGTCGNDYTGVQFCNQSLFNYTFCYGGSGLTPEEMDKNANSSLNAFFNRYGIDDPAPDCAAAGMEFACWSAFNECKGSSSLYTYVCKSVCNKLVHTCFLPENLCLFYPEDNCTPGN